MPVSSMSAQADGIVAAIEAVEVGDLAVLFLVADAGVEHKAGVGVRGHGVAQVGADERALDDFSEAVGNVDVAILELGDGPDVGVGDAALGFAFG